MERDPEEKNDSRVKKTRDPDREKVRNDDWRGKDENFNKEGKEGVEEKKKKKKRREGRKKVKAKLKRKFRY